MKLINVMSSSHIDVGVENNDKDPNGHARSSNYKNIFAKGYTPNWTKKVYVIKKS